ncbi:MAG: DUF3040 domain-containing protein [Actinobacteria bacterium]|nr:DUF3040 domain-containing protein [Actinomycetota bacterium]
MPLSDREQKILAEIERHFYAEDPRLVRAARKIDPNQRFGTRGAVLGIVIGTALVGAAISRFTWLAVIGFVLVVISATRLITTVIADRQEKEEEGQTGEESDDDKGRGRLGRD